MDRQLMKAKIQAELSRIIYEHDMDAIDTNAPLFPIGATGLVNRGMDALFDEWRKSDEQ